MRTALTGLIALNVAMTACKEETPIPKVPPTPATEKVFEDALIEIGPVELAETIKEKDARFVVVNVWATWCGPCREEFPYIQEVTRSYADKGVELMFVTTDFEEEEAAAVEFLESQGADLPSYRKIGPDEAFIDALNPRWSGALPATVIFDSEGNRKKAWTGKVERAELEAALEELTRS